MTCHLSYEDSDLRFTLHYWCGHDTQTGHLEIGSMKLSLCWYWSISDHTWASSSYWSFLEVLPNWKTSVLVFCLFTLVAGIAHRNPMSYMGAGAAWLKFNVLACS